MHILHSTGLTTCKQAHISSLCRSASFVTAEFPAAHTSPRCIVCKGNADMTCWLRLLYLHSIISKDFLCALLGWGWGRGDRLRHGGQSYLSPTPILCARVEQALQLCCTIRLALGICCLRPPYLYRFACVQDNPGQRDSHSAQLHCLYTPAATASSDAQSKIMTGDTIQNGPTTSQLLHVYRMHLQDQMYKMTNSSTNTVRQRPLV